VGLKKGRTAKKRFDIDKGVFTALKAMLLRLLPGARGNVAADLGNVLVAASRFGAEQQIDGVGIGHGRGYP
jgi:hypothetical protein